MNDVQNKEAKKHKHHDLIVQWVKDTNQNVWVYSKESLNWVLVRATLWDQNFDYKIQENKPTEPPVKKVSFFDGGIEFDLSIIPRYWVEQEQQLDTCTTALYIQTEGVKDNKEVYSALRELATKRLKH